MDDEILRTAGDLAAREVPFALATVVRRAPPVSARPGDKAIILADGALRGWVGGACAHATVVGAALRALADGAPRLLVLDPAPERERRPGVEVFPMACHSGGSLEIYVEPHLPRPRLVILGASPIAEALARLAPVVGYRVYVLDPLAARARFPDADGVFAELEPEGVWERGETFVLVTTMGHADDEALRTALAHSSRYVAVVASGRRFEELRRALARAGVPAEAIGRVKNPAGLDIHARLPEEIALSVLAEVVQTRRREAAPLAAGPSGRAPEARLAADPVCGMMVDRSAAPAELQHGGTTYYFCCHGCKTRFEDDRARRGVPA